VSDDIAIVVGAGSGLGQATAIRLAESGARVIGVDRNLHGLEQLPKKIQRRVADATDPYIPGPLIDQIAKEIGPPKVLVNTIGMYDIGGTLTVTPEDLNAMFDVNVAPALWLTQAVAPYMIEGGAGAIVHVGARPGIEPSPGFAAYSASKAALAHLVKVMDAEFRPQGIRVNAVAPAAIATEKNMWLAPAEVMAHAVAPEAIAEVIAFLVSDAASPVSGAVIPTYGA
jgi:NAD(P)-dependent dehydrogenase (short-subunit alcohol dehydrogenase family)